MSNAKNLVADLLKNGYLKATDSIEKARIEFDNIASQMKRLGVDLGFGVPELEREFEQYSFNN